MGTRDDAARNIAGKVYDHIAPILVPKGLEKLRFTTREQVSKQIKHWYEHVAKREQYPDQIADQIVKIYKTIYDVTDKLYSIVGVENKNYAIASIVGALREIDDDLSTAADEFFGMIEIGVKNIEDTISELITTDPKSRSEAPSFEPLEHIAFAKNRRDIIIDEKDTKLETRLWNVLRAHFGSSTAFEADVARLIKHFLRLGVYEKVFAEPTADDVYRGMTVPTGVFADMYGRDELRDGLSSLEGTITKPYTFVPRSGGSSSWTTSEQTAVNFSMNFDDVAIPSLMFSVVLYAKTSENPNGFIEGTLNEEREGLANVAGFDEFDEDEVVGLGSIEVVGIAWKLHHMFETRFTKEIRARRSSISDEELHTELLARVNRILRHSGWDGEDE